MKRVERLADWLRPTFTGTLLGSWVIATIAAIEWDELGEWPARMLRATLVAGLLGVVLAAVDVALARRGVREIPLKNRAFWTSFAAPIVAELFWILPSWEDPTLSLLALGGKLIVTALLVRLLFGRLPARS